MEFFEKQIATKTVFQGKIITVCLDKVELPDGNVADREVAYHNGAVGIIPIDEHGQVILVRQFRYPFERELLEIPAGKLEKGEEHYECALRELSEETGCTAGKMTYLGTLYTSPGFSNELLHLYLATELKQGKMHLDKDEFLSVLRMPMDTLVDMIMANELSDGKTVAGILKAKKYLEQEAQRGENRTHC